jgi:outer membrane protein assembly factor BamB
MTKIYTFCIVSLLAIGGVGAQTPINHPKKYYVDSLNRYHLQAELPVYIHISTSPDGKTVPLAPNDQREVKPIYLDGHGKHTLKHVDGLHQTEDKFWIYADGLAPISNIAFLNAPRFNNAGKQYYGQNLILTLVTKDEMSGIQGLYHSLNGEDFKLYGVPLRFDKEGNYTHKYYAVDNVGNTEALRSNDFTVDLSTPNTYHNIVGIADGNIISTSTRIYLTPSDSISGLSRTFYRLDGEPEKPYIARNLVPFSYLPDGEHTLTYYSVDNVENREKDQTFTFYLDKTSPIMSADVLGDRFIVDNKVYFSGRTKLKLTAVDNKSGIKEIKFSIDGQEYDTYKDAFYLPSQSGVHTIRYYALDNMGNQGVGNSDQKVDEFLHNVSQVYVDLTGPVLNYQYAGPIFQKGDTVFISNRSRVQLAAFDPESGLQKITYSIDGETQENPYQGSFSISQAGAHKVEFYGYDNVNNRNVRSFNLMVDNDGPIIYPSFSNSPTRTEDAPVYPSYVTLFLAATDLNTGLEQIYYKINGEAEVPYTGIIRGFKKNRVYNITIRATDLLGNQNERTITFKTDKY